LPDSYASRLIFLRIADLSPLPTGLSTRLSIELWIKGGASPTFWPFATHIDDYLTVAQIFL